MVRIFARGENNNASRPLTVYINREGRETGIAGRIRTKTSLDPQKLI